MGTAPVYAVSSWSLHRRLGLVYPDAPGAEGDGQALPEFGSGELSVFDVPADLKAHGFDRLELCHFHIPGRDRAAVARMAAALSAAGVTLQTLLIDDGDVAQPDTATRTRDCGWIAGWIDIAAALGASHVRVIAGQQLPEAAALDRSVGALRELASHANAKGVRITTENWFALTAGPREVHHLLDRLEGHVGLLADTGNWKGPSKYDDLAAIFGRAERCHAKAHFNDGRMDRHDFRQCLDAAARAGYQGPFTLVYESPGDEWAGVLAERAAIDQHSSATG
jgi:sugar phosphate isomerase/epimerase